MSVIYLQLMRIAIGITKIMCDFLLEKLFRMTNPWMQNQAHTDHTYIHGNKIVIKINATIVFPPGFVMTQLQRVFPLSALSRFKIGFCLLFASRLNRECMLYSYTNQVLGLEKPPLNYTF